MSTYKITVLGNEFTCESTMTYGELAKMTAGLYSDEIILAKYENHYREFFKPLDGDGEVSFETIAEAEGMRTYRRSLKMLLYYAADRFYGEERPRLHVLHHIQEGYYLEAENRTFTQEEIDALKKIMQEAVEKDLPFFKKNLPTRAARAIFREHQMAEKDELFNYRRVSHTNMYEIDGYMDYYYGYIAGSAGQLSVFDLKLYENGFILLFPSTGNTHEVAPFTGSPKLYQTLTEGTEFGRKLHCDTIAGLNHRISEGHMPEIILAQEALMEKKISDIAAHVGESGNIKFIMIAGPSSSGKTSFANRLCIQLFAQGMRPHMISLDDFYMDRDKMQPNEKGELDFEALEALDLEAINRTLNALLKGERVELPTFNFKKGKQEFTGKHLQMGEDDVLVIEGIHGLNDAISKDVPADQKYKVYISALSQVDIDENNSTSVTDGRLLRRMIRDARTRGTGAAETISRWPSVRAGEEKHIFPFQEQADVMFNSALIFELPLIKVYAEPLLFGIPEDAPEYPEAKRLLKLLDYVLPYPSDALNKNSLLREFVGGSCFNV